MTTPAALAAHSTQPCPAWCEPDADSHSGQLHMGHVHEVGDLGLNLHQDFGGDFAMIGLFDYTDQEIFLSPDEAEQVAWILLRLVRAVRKA